MSYNTGGGYSCGTCSVSYNPGTGYSALESTVNRDYMAAEASAPTPMQFYENNAEVKNYSDSYQSSRKVIKINNTAVDDFLNPSRPKTAFIGNASEIREFAEEAFFKTTGMQFPDDIIVKILSKEHFREGLQGYAINRKEEGMISEVVVKEDTMDRVMVILGHELGHVMSRRFNEKRNEEAKAFAFSIAWIKAIKENNIAGLSTAVCVDRPARNGIHDFAHSFVISMIQRGKSALEVFKGIVSGEIKCH